MRLQSLDLRDQIISLLSEHFPLTVHELVARLRERYQRTVSKQAVHKALRGLGERVLLKKAHSYQLSPAFVLALSAWSEQCRRRYFPPDAQGFALAARQRRVLTCGSLLELDTLWNTIVSEKILQHPLPAPDYCQYVPHAWFALTHLEAEIKVTSFITERCRSFYTLAAGDYMLDSWIGRFYRGGTSFYRCGVLLPKSAPGYQCTVMGDYLLETVFPDDLALQMRQVFAGATALINLNLGELVRLVGMARELSFSLSRDAKRAARLRKAILAPFGE